MERLINIFIWGLRIYFLWRTFEIVVMWRNAWKYGWKNMRTFENINDIFLFSISIASWFV
jgi:hypothetical protein